MTELLLGPHCSDNVLRIARVFMAIQEAIGQLRGLYGRLPAAPPAPQTIALWPRPTGDPPESTERLPKLEFFAKVNRADGTPLSSIDEDNENHAMYLARMQIKTSTPAEAPTEAEASTQDVDVFVKFATKYHADAHRLLADHNPPLAPALHFCAPVVGDMYMIVMEYIPESAGRSVHSYFSTGGSPGLLQAIERDVSQALKLLHERNWVFGDLRAPNILHLPGSDGGRVLLVDFDGVGVDGEGRYSTCLNHAAGFCASVQRGGVMRKKHDLENLKGLLGRLRRNFSET